MPYPCAKPWDLKARLREGHAEVAVTVSNSGGGGKV